MIMLLKFPRHPWTLPILTMEKRQGRGSLASTLLGWRVLHFMSMRELIINKREFDGFGLFFFNVSIRQSNRKLTTYDYLFLWA